MKPVKVLTLIGLCILGVGLVFALAARSTPAANLQDFGEGETVVVHAYFDDPRMVADLAAWKEPWQVDYEKGIVVVEVNADEYEALEAAGFNLFIDEMLTAQVNHPRHPLPGQLVGIPGYPCYRTVEETYGSAQDIVAAHPDLAAWIDVGDSWEKASGLGGYDLLVLRLTNESLPGPKPKLFAMTSVHAREYTPAELNTRFAEYLVDNYGLDADVTWLLDYHEMHLLLQANPDGRKQAETGFSWRKNTNQNYCGPTSNLRGADLNRNFSFQWGCCGGSSDSQCSEVYRGPSPASEPETQAIQDYVLSQYPDLRDPPLDQGAPITTTGVFLDIHSFSELMLWPWGFTSAPTANGLAMQTLGRKLAYFNDYEPQQAINLYPTDGTTGDFAYGDLGLPAFTYELGTAFFQSCGVFENTILPDNLDSLIYAAKVVRAPYLTPAGPDALNLTLSENVVAPGSVVTLTATVDDTRFNNENGVEPTQAIAAAEAYINVPHWVTTTTPVPLPMVPVDGSFDTPVETAQVVVDTSGLANGRHTLFVRGQDAPGNWGAVSAIFLYIVDPDVAPVIQGQVTAADSGLPLSATVSAGVQFQANTDPTTGNYSLQVVSGTYNLTAQPLSPAYASRTITGVVASDFQTVTQDFALYPYCNAFFDDVEAGNPGWNADTPWAITTESAHSPTHSWTDSPGGSYANNRNISLTSPILDLSGYEEVTLEFWQICDTEAGWDFCHVEISSNGGATWGEVATFDGPHGTWEQVSLPVPDLDDQPNARVRFRFTSDFSVIDDGWHLDDIRILGAGPNCVTASAPLAGFESTSPDILGTTTSFTNTSTGGGLSFQWDFGDGSPLSAEVHPTHMYTATGTYTVTLTASNLAGSDTAVGQVEILAGYPNSSYLPLIKRED